MIQVTISGNLAAEPRLAFKSKFAGGGDTYQIRLGTTQNVHKGGQTEQVTVWAGGLINSTKIVNMLPYLKKGKAVVCCSTRCRINKYVDKNGDHQASLDLGYIDYIELGGDPEPPQPKTEVAEVADAVNGSSPFDF